MSTTETASATIDDPLGRPQPSLLTRLRRIRGWPAGLMYITIFVLFVGVGIFAPVLAPQDPNHQELVERLQPPAWQEDGSWDRPLGTDDLGRDVLSRMIYGTQIALLVVAIGIPITMALGTTLGLLAGFRGGFADKVLMRLVDLQLAFPAILFAVLIAAIFGPSLRNVILVIVIFGSAAYARVVRGEVLSLRERDFVSAARSIGASEKRIVARHILPNLVNTIVVLMTLEVAVVIFIEAALSFLGVGTPVTQPSWGQMISEGRDYIQIAWWLPALPGLAIVALSLVANLAGDWLRDVLDPRRRNVR